MTKEQISDIIYEEIYCPSCYNCSGKNDCKNCNHWTISREEADRIADEILKGENK